MDERSSLSTILAKDLVLDPVVDIAEGIRDIF